LFNFEGKSRMNAIGYYQSLPIENEQSLIDLDLPTPKASGHDILVAVKAIAVNPIDTKIRRMPCLKVV
jgi:NADPH:quinone reductase-like Zn-dependent oxidoreductase